MLQRRSVSCAALIAFTTKHRQRLQVVVALAVVALFACQGDRTTAPLAGVELSRLDGRPLDPARMRNLREFGEGCSFTVNDSSGGKRAIVARRAKLPFTIPPLTQDPSTGRWNGRSVLLHFSTPANPDTIYANCWIPSDMSDSALYASVATSAKAGAWEKVRQALRHAPVFSAQARAQTPSREAQELAYEMTSTASAPGMSAAARVHVSSGVTGLTGSPVTPGAGSSYDDISYCSGFQQMALRPKGGTPVSANLRPQLSSTGGATPSFSFGDPSCECVSFFGEIGHDQNGTTLFEWLATACVIDMGDNGQAQFGWGDWPSWLSSDDYDFFNDKEGGGGGGGGCDCVPTPGVGISANAYSVEAGDSVTLTAVPWDGTMSTTNWVWTSTDGEPLTSSGACSGTTCTMSVYGSGSIYLAATVGGTAVVSDTLTITAQFDSGYVYEAGTSCSLQPPGDSVPPHPALPYSSGPRVPGPDGLSDACPDDDGPCVKMLATSRLGSILLAAINQGQWHYTQGGDKGGIEHAKDPANKYGDCGDFVKASVAAAVPEWGGSYITTYDFHHDDSASLAQAGYVRIDSAAALPGDILVDDDHAGIYVGIQRDTLIAWANNGFPAYPTAPGHTGNTIGTKFTNGPATFYRVVIPCTLPSNDAVPRPSAAEDAQGTDLGPGRAGGAVIDAAGHRSGSDAVPSPSLSFADSDDDRAIDLAGDA